MNYEELVSSYNSNGNLRKTTPIGVMQKRLADTKYETVLILHEWFASDPIFISQIKKESLDTIEFKNEYQVPFILNDNAAELIIGQGSYVSIEQFLNENPAMCADAAFVRNLLKQIVEWGSEYHSRGIYHLCFSPGNVFIHRKTRQLALVSHGSYYLQGNTVKAIYKDSMEYVAPEVLGGTVDERCDVYSVGKLLQFIFHFTDVPFVYKKIIAKSTEILPEDRYSSLDGMLSAFNSRRSMVRSAKEFGFALVIALIIVGAYFSINSVQNQVEYVKPAGKDVTEDYMDENFDPTEAMEILASDTASMITPEQQKKLDEYKKKAADIFRRRYEKEAQQVLTGVYSRKYKNTSNQNFVEINQAAIEELIKKQTDIAAQTGIDPNTSQKIAQEVIDKVSTQLQNMQNNK